jgi:nitrogen regulatory protein PII
MLKAVKKVEIIVSEVEVSSVLKIFKKNQIKKYTVINNLSGTGKHGSLSDGLITNSHIMVILPELEMLDILSKELQPLLSKLGGIFIVTDAQWIDH